MGFRQDLLNIIGNSQQQDTCLALSPYISGR